MSAASASDDRDQEGVPQARARAAPRRQPARPRGRGEVQGGGGGLRGAERPRAARRLRPLRARGPALAAASSRTSPASAASPTSSRRSSAAATRSGRCSAAARAGPRAASDVARRGRADARGGRCTGVTTEVEVEVARALLALQRQRRRARHADRDLPALRGDRPAAVGRRGPCSARSCAARPATAAAATGGSRETAVRRLRRRGARARDAQPVGRRPGRHRRRPARCGSSGRGHAGRARRPGRRPLRARHASQPDPRFERHGDDLVTRLDVPVHRRGAGRDASPSPTLEGEEEIELEPGHAARRRCVRLRGRGLPSLRGRRRGDLHVVVNVMIPSNLSDEQRELLRRFAESANGENYPAERERRRAVRPHPRRRFAVDPARGPLPRATRPRRCSPSCSSWRRAASRRSTRPDGATGVVEYAVYGAPGELPELGALQAAAGGALVEVRSERGARRLGRALEALLLPGAGRRAAVRAPAVGAAGRARRGRRRS